MGGQRHPLQGNFEAEIWKKSGNEERVFWEKEHLFLHFLSHWMWVWEKEESRANSRFLAWVTDKLEMLLSPRRAQEEQVWAAKSGVLFGRMKLDKPPPKFVADTATTRHCSRLNPNVASTSPQHFRNPHFGRKLSLSCYWQGIQWVCTGEGSAAEVAWSGKVARRREKLEVSFLSVRGLLVASARKPKSKWLKPYRKLVAHMSRRYQGD